MKAYDLLKNSMLAAAIGCALSSCYDLTTTILA